MIKCRLLWCLVLTFFSITVLTVSAFSEVSAVSPTVTVTPGAKPPFMQQETPAATIPANQEVSDYLLPHPGMLPDHPLYFFKVLRDRLLDFLIRDPLKRIEFNLLMADKRLNMGVALVDKQNIPLAEETISKGEKYFVKAVDAVEIAKNQGRELPPDLPDRLSTATVKHEQVINTLIDKSPEENKEGFRASAQLVLENRERIFSLGK